MMDIFRLSTKNKDIELKNPGFIQCVVGETDDKDCPYQVFINTDGINIENALTAVDAILNHLEQKGYIERVNDD